MPAICTVGWTVFAISMGLTAGALVDSRRPSAALSGIPLMNHPRFLAPILALLAVPLAAAPKQTADLLFATRWYAGVAVSPDASRVAWVELRPNADRTPSAHAAIYVRAMEGGQPGRISAGNGKEPRNERD